MVDDILKRSVNTLDLPGFIQRLANPNVDINGQTRPNSSFAHAAGSLTILMQIMKKLNEPRFYYLYRNPNLDDVKDIFMKMIKEVLKHPQLDINLTNDYGESALWYANEPEILKILLAHPKIDVNISRSSYLWDLVDRYVNNPNEKNLELIKILLEDGRVEPSIPSNPYIKEKIQSTPEIKTLLEKYIPPSKYPSIYRRMLSEVATMSGTDTTSNVQSRTLPQLPLGVSSNIYEFLYKPKSKSPIINEETKRYQERVAKEKEAAEQKQQADKDYRAREGILSARDSTPWIDPDPTSFKGTNPRNLGGRKTKSSSTKRGGRKTRRKRTVFI